MHFVLCYDHYHMQYFIHPLSFLQCAQLLRFLGLPVIKSEGEAEACCAFLNKEKVCSLLLVFILLLAVHLLD